MAVILLFGFSLTWIFAIIGLSVSNAETAQAASFPILAPLVFASSAFVPVRLDAGLAPGVRQEPAGFDRDQRGAGARARRPLCRAPAQVLESIAWSLGIIAVFAPLAVRRYRRAAEPQRHCLQPDCYNVMT